MPDVIKHSQNTKKINSKAQAAMEFLMTYGWAILVVLLVISVLAYMGFLNPSNLIPDRCYLGEKLDCTDFKAEQIGGVGKVSFLFTNKYNKIISFSAVNVSTQYGDCYNWPTGGYYAPFGGPFQINPGASFNVVVGACPPIVNNMKANTKYKFKVGIQYTLPDSSLQATRVDTGEILTKIER
ncbi:MAG: hypothetical protein AABX51_05630 [Nanoarchaeota archaeon]